MNGIFDQIFGGVPSGIDEFMTEEQKAAITRNAMLTAAASLLQAGGPSTTRTNLGQALGSAFLSGQQAVQSGQKNVLEGMLTKQKLDEYKREAANRASWQKILSGETPAAGGITNVTGAAAPAAPAAPAAAGTAKPTTSTMQATLSLLSPDQRALIATMPMEKGQEQLFNLTQQALEFGAPTAVMVDGKPVMMQYNKLGQSRVATGISPYEALPPEVRATEYVTGSSLAGKGTTGMGAIAQYGMATRPPSGGGGLKLTPGQEAVDKKFAESYLDWQQGGGADSIANIAQIGTVLARLEKNQPLTGPMVGIQPDFVLAITNPAAAGSMEQVQEVVQRNLRVILGAQFTAKEGESIIKRAYNPSLSPQENAARLRKLFQQMSVAAQQKQDMANYYEANGTLQGYKGKMPNVNDFYKALEVRQAPKAGDVVGGFKFKGGDPNNENNWVKVQ